MSTVVSCRCGSTLSARDGLVGKRARCPECGFAVLVTARPPRPAADAAQAAGSQGLDPAADYAHWGFSGLVLVLISYLAFFNQQDPHWARSLSRLLDVSAADLIGLGSTDNLAVFAVCLLAGILGVLGLGMCIISLRTRCVTAPIGFFGIVVFLLKAAIIVGRHVPPYGRSPW